MQAHVKALYGTLQGRSGPGEVLPRPEAHATVHGTGLETRGSLTHRAAWGRLLVIPKNEG